MKKTWKLVQNFEFNENNMEYRKQDFLKRTLKPLKLWTMANESSEWACKHDINQYLDSLNDSNKWMVCNQTNTWITCQTELNWDMKVNQTMLLHAFHCICVDDLITMFWFCTWHHHSCLTFLIESTKSTINSTKWWEKFNRFYQHFVWFENWIFSWQKLE